MHDEPKSDPLVTVMAAVPGSPQPVAACYPAVFSSFALPAAVGARTYARLAADREHCVVEAATRLACDAPAPDGARVPNRVAFLMQCLKGPLHAPTKTLYAYQAAIAALQPQLRSAIIVTDDGTPSPGEWRPIGIYESEPSSLHWAEHERLMPGVPVQYSDSLKSRRDRVLEDRAALAQFRPDVVIAFGAESTLLRPLIYPHYPVLGLSMGGPPGSSFCDVYAGAQSASDIEEIFASSGLNRPAEIRRHAYGMNLPAPMRRISRSDLGLPENDFVVCSVGTRIDGEMDADFLDVMESLLVARPAARWLVVGGRELRQVRARSRLWEKVVAIAYETDLPALLACCDAFANPFRMGGGTSVAMAMDRGMPVVSLETSQDAISMLGAGRGVCGSDAYLAALLRLCDDAAHRERVGLEVRDRIRGLVSWDRAVLDLMSLVDLTRRTFEARIARPGSALGRASKDRKPLAARMG